MLTSITPLGERVRGQRWGITVTFFVAGSALAGGAVGLALGWAGELARLGAVGWRERAALLGAVVFAGLVVELLGRPVPGPRRQVNENWLPSFRGWIYGLGFGLQLGAGATTIVSTSLVYATFFAALLVASPIDGLVIGGAFGALRGAAILPSWQAQSATGLAGLSSRLERWRTLSSRLALATQGAVVVALAFMAI